MSNEILLLWMGIILAVIAILLAITAFIKVMVIAAEVRMIGKAPVLRQYVERFVPIDNSEDAQETIKRKMLELEEQFEKSMNLTPQKRGYNARAEGNILRAEELV